VREQLEIEKKFTTHIWTILGLSPNLASPSQANWTFPCNIKSRKKKCCSHVKRCWKTL